MAFTDADLKPLYAQASGAIAAGADPVAVNQMMKAKLDKLGVDTSKTIAVVGVPDGSPVPKDIKDVWGIQDFGDVEGGSKSVHDFAPKGKPNYSDRDLSPMGVRSGVDVNNFADITNPIANKFANSVQDFGMGLAAPIATGAGVLQVATAGTLTHSPIVPQSMTDAMFASGDKYLDAGNTLASASDTASGLLGQFGGAALGGWLVGHPARAFEDVRAGKSLPKAYTDLLRDTAVNEIGTAAGLAGPQTAGARAYLARAGIQGATNVGLTAVNKAIDGEHLTNSDWAMGLGGAALSAHGRNPRGTHTEVPSTGDPIVDAGIQHVTDSLPPISGEAPKKAYDFKDAAKRQSEQLPIQEEMFSAEQPGLFGDSTPADLAEGRRAASNQATADAAAGVAGDVSRSPSQDAKLQVDFLQARKERLAAAQAANDAVTKEQGLSLLEGQHDAGNNPEPAVQHPDLWDVGTPVNEQPVEATLHAGRNADGSFNLDDPTGYTEQAPNDSVREAFRAARLRRATDSTGNNLYPDVAHTDHTQQDLLSNNGSGESSASLEAQHRVADEKAAGQDRFVIEPDGSVRPIVGVDAVDTNAGKGQVIVQRNIAGGKGEWTPISSDPSISPERARGIADAHSDKLNSALADTTDTPTASGEHDFSSMFPEEQDTAPAQPAIPERTAPVAAEPVQSELPLNHSPEQSSIFDKEPSGDHGFAAYPDSQAAKDSATINKAAARVAELNAKAKAVPLTRAERSERSSLQKYSGNPERLNDVMAKINPDNSTAAAAAKPKTLQESLADLKASRGLSPKAADGGNDLLTLDGANVFSKNHGIAASVVEKIRNKTATAKDVIDGFLNDLNGRYAKGSEVHNLIKDISDFTEASAGDKARVEIYDHNDKVHQSIAGRSKNFGRAHAVYDPTTHTILLNKEASVATLLHEVVHATTSRAIHLGESRQLPKPAQAAYDHLSNVFDALQTHLKDRAADNFATSKVDHGPMAASATNHRQTYGLTDLHELVAELHTNGTFRQFLRGIDVNSLPLSPFQKHVVGRFNNVYNAIVSILPKVLGLTPKATSAYDHLMGSYKNFSGSLDRPTVGLIKARQESAVATREALRQPEAAPLASKMAPNEEPALRRASGPIERVAKNMLLTKTNVPEMHKARNEIIGGVQEAKLVGNTTLRSMQAAQGHTTSADITTAIEGGPDSQAALAAIKQSNPKLGELLQAFKDKKVDNVIDLADVMLSNKNAGAKDQNIVRKAIETANTYLTKAYQVVGDPKWGIRLKQRAANGDIAAQQTIKNAADYITSKWIEPLYNLDSLTPAHVTKLFEMHSLQNAKDLWPNLSEADRQLAMKTQLIGVANSIVSKEKYVGNIVNTIAGLNKDQASSIAKYYLGAARGGDILQTRVDIPAPIAALMGEITDPIHRASITMTTQMATVARLKAQQRLYDEGIANGVFTTKRGTDSHTVQIEGEGMGPLKGMYTTPDVAAAIQASDAMHASINDTLALSELDPSGALLHGWAIDTATSVASRASGVYKMLQLLGAPFNMVRNLAGNPFQMITNGNLSPAYYAKGAKAVFDALALGRRKEIAGDTARLLRLNLLEHAQSSELQRGLSNAAIETLRKVDGLEMSAGRKAVKAMYKAGTIGLDVYKEVYNAMDMIPKIANFYKDRDLYDGYFDHVERADPSKKLSADDRDRYVANVTNNTNITPSNSPRVVKLAERLGLNWFLPYKYQTARSLVYNMAYGIDHIKKGMDAPGGMYTPMVVDGIKRIVGTVGATATANKLYATAAAGVFSAIGLTATKLASDDPRKKHMENDPFLQTQEPALAVDPKHPDTTLSYDAAMLNPNDPTTGLITAITKAMYEKANGNNEAATTATDEALNRFSSLIFTQNALYKQLYSIASGKAPSMSRTNEDLYNKYVQSITENTPLSGKGADRIIAAGETVVPKTVKTILSVWGRDDISDKGKLLVGAGTGVGQQDFTKDVDKYLAPGSMAKIKEAKNGYLSLMKRDFESSPEKIESTFIASAKAAAKPYKDLQLGVQAALEDGTNPEVMKKILTTNKVPDSIARKLIQDRPLTAGDLIGDLQSDFQSDNVEALRKGDSNSEARQRYNYNSNQLRELMATYRNTEIDQL